jgi:hypothetical protein
MDSVLHHDILITITYLLTMPRSRGKYEQAEEMLRQELSLSETVWGKEHASTLMA